MIEWLIRMKVALRSRWGGAVLRLRGVRMEGKSWLQGVRVPRNPRDIVLGKGVMLDEGVILLTTGPRRDEPRILIGGGTYINRSTFLDATERIEIGPQCLIGPFCYITDHDHDLERPGAFIEKPTAVEEGCWIGAHVTLLKGVTVGAHSIIGAGSVVTKSIPPRSVVAGNPARVIRERPPGA